MTGDGEFQPGAARSEVAGRPVCARRPIREPPPQQQACPIAAPADDELRRTPVNDREIICKGIIILTLDAAWLVRS